MDEATNMRRSVRVRRIAGGLCLLATTAPGCPGCPPTNTKGTTIALGNPVNFDASNDLKTCTFKYSPGGSSSDPDFTLNYGGNGITIKATYAGGTSTTFDEPPGSFQITYGDSSATAFDSGNLTIFPSPSSNVTLVENKYTDWSVTAKGTGSSQKLAYGGTWTITFSCGATPACCQNTPRVSVVADGTP